MAVAWISSILSSFCNPALASSTVFDFLIKAITSSSLSKAFRRAERMWALFSASFNLY